MRFRRSMLLLMFSLAACGQSPAATPADMAATSGAPSVVALHSDEHGPGKEIEANDPAPALVTLDLMRGHLIASLENAKTQDYTSAQQHAIHPLAEHYGQIKSQVQQTEVALDPQLEAALKAYQQQLEARVDLTTLERSKAEIDAVLTKIEQALVPNHSDVHSRALAAVITTAANEYAESIADGAFVAPIDYQDAFGFTRSATARFEALKGDLDAHAAEETRTALEILTAAMPAITPPKTVLKSVAEVAAAADEAEAELDRAQANGTN